MKILKSLFFILITVIFSQIALADPVNYNTIAEAAQNSDDLSRKTLLTIFGDVVTQPLTSSDSTLIGKLFGTFNGVIATIALVWFLIVTLKHVVKSGGEGKVFGNGRSHIYPVISLFGFFSLVPTVSGWSIAQLVMLWAASIMGIGSANILTNKGADLINNGHSLVIQPTAPETRDAAQALFEANLCMFTFNKELDLIKDDSSVTKTKYITITGIENSIEFTNGNVSCGSAYLRDNNILDSDPSALDAINTVSDNTEAIKASQRNAFISMQNTLKNAAEKFVNDYLTKRDEGAGALDDIETIIQKTATDYENTINNTLLSINFEDSLQNRAIDQLKKYGWASLGSYYQTFATANQKLESIVKNSPIVKGASAEGDLGAGELYNEVFIAYQLQLQNTSYVAPLGTKMTQREKDEIESSNTKNTSNLLVSFLESPMLNITNKIATSNIGSSNSFNEQMNPLLKMKAIGDYTLIGSEAALGAYVTARGVVAGVKGNTIGRVFNILTGAGDMAESILDSVQPILYFFLFILFCIGFSLSIFLPFIPFIYWIIALANWIVSVLVGCAAGPLWAATHLGTEEDKGSRANYGYIFLIDVMLRPSLMVFGFFFASITLVGIGSLLNILFAPALANVQADSVTGIVSMIGFLLIYARICTQLVTKIFLLQVNLPDYVIAFLGGREAANVLGGMVESVHSAVGGFVRGTGRTPTPKSIDLSKGNNFNQDGVK